jgi:hypothetical protein
MKSFATEMVSTLKRQRSLTPPAFYRHAADNLCPPVREPPRKESQAHASFSVFELKIAHYAVPAFF